MDFNSWFIFRSTEPLVTHSDSSSFNFGVLSKRVDSFRVHIEDYNGNLIIDRDFAYDEIKDDTTFVNWACVHLKIGSFSSDGGLVFFLEADAEINLPTAFYIM